MNYHYRASVLQLNAFDWLYVRLLNIENSKKSLVCFFEELVYAITEYNYLYGAVVAHLASNRRTRRKKCNAQRISLWTKKI